MPPRRQYQNLDFEIHVDPSCMSVPSDDIAAMEHRDVVEAADLTAEERHLQANAERVNSLQPTVEDVADGSDDDSDSRFSADGEEDDHGLNNEDNLDLVEEQEHSLISQEHNHDLAEAATNADLTDIETEIEGQADQLEKLHVPNTSDGDIKRWPSLRTEALIHAAARDIVNHVSSHPRKPVHDAETLLEEDEQSLTVESYTSSPRHSFGPEPDVEGGQEFEEDDAKHETNTDEAGDSSSHHEHEDCVFSDNSPRSSMGSLPDGDQHKLEQRFSSPRTRSSRISDIPHSDQDEDFIPTIRGTPRPPFRSPSSVKAIQMSSPPASVLGSPRSKRRTPRQSMSRLGSPSISAQYSPKKTPPRFRRSTPPLVLLHVTLLPSRWAWGHVLESAQISDLSPEGKNLWESWTQLQDRTGDTVCDRGVLLPHPQNDYEVLEERLLEALELPLRRRARILECGHYLGPSNESFLSTDVDSEDDDYYGEVHSPRQSLTEKTHWCQTCRSDIRYDTLGAGKVFRVKVYASNGLMRAGAWEACWKEMERVDVELEPIVEPQMQEELKHLALEQERAIVEQEAAEAAAAAAVDEELRIREAGQAYIAHESHHEETSYIPVDQQESNQPYISRHVEETVGSFMPELADASPQAPPESSVRSSPRFEEERRARDEERLREIYGHSPPSHTDDSSAPQSPYSSFVPQQTPPSPSAQADERREERRQMRREGYKSASLPELVFEAIRVLIQDQKNVIIGVLSVLVLMLAIRGAGSAEGQNENAVKNIIAIRPAMDTLTAAPVVEVQLETPVPVSVSTLQETPGNLPEMLSQSWDEKANGQDASQSTTIPTTEQDLTEQADPCVTCSSSLEIAEMALKQIPVSTVEIFHTVTETVVETLTLAATPDGPQTTAVDETSESISEEPIFEGSPLLEESVPEEPPVLDKSVPEEPICEEAFPEPTPNVEHLEE